MSERTFFSVVAPAHNEEDNVRPLVERVGAAARAVCEQWPEVDADAFEMIVVDDGSTDQTRARLEEMQRECPWLRIIAMTQTPPGKGNGQSAAFHAGFRAARGELIGVLDADLQNDPADYPAMATLLREQQADMVQGDRSRDRQDNLVRKIGSIVGRKFRLWLLGDTIRDTGCSLRLMKREIALQLPLEFRGMHRFIPVTARHLGYTVVEMGVSHHARVAGETKYGFGITQRALPGLIDCFAIRWMRTRRRPVTSVEIASEQPEVVSRPSVPSAEVRT